jgi:hypothetical protein
MKTMSICFCFGGGGGGGGWLSVTNDSECHSSPPPPTVTLTFVISAFLLSSIFPRPSLIDGFFKLSRFQDVIPYSEIGFP